MMKHFSLFLFALYKYLPNGGAVTLVLSAGRRRNILGKLNRSLREEREPQLRGIAGANNRRAAGRRSTGLTLPCRPGMVAAAPCRGST